MTKLMSYDEFVSGLDGDPTIAAIITLEKVAIGTDKTIFDISFYTAICKEMFKLYIRQNKKFDKQDTRKGLAHKRW